MLMMKRADTESTASIARLAAIIVSTASLATESPAAAAVAAFIHGAITRDMANFATYDQIFKEHTFVAIGSGTAHSSTLLRTAFLLRTLPGEMACFSAAITSFTLWGFGTIAGKMSSLWLYG
jgi:hypothetical protein